MAKQGQAAKKEQATKEEQTPASAPRKRVRKNRQSVRTQFHRLTKPFRVLGQYFGGAWQELRQVRWPNRGATWSLTLAVILFSLFFAALILGLDAAFSYLFKEILL